LPRHTETPPEWSASNDGYVCAESISYVTGAAETPAANAKPRNVETNFVDELIGSVSLYIPV
jgi:hypothetical protein